jgi:hypothetical protein
VTWFLDGNNMLALVLGTRRRPDDRERFLEHLLQFRLPSPFTLVFDGPPPDSSPSREKRLGKASVVYSGSRSADEVILGRIKPGDRVVTADRELRLRCRGRGAKPVQPTEFLSDLQPRVGVSRAEKPSPISVDVDEWMDFFGKE